MQSQHHGLTIHKSLYIADCLALTVTFPHSYINEVKVLMTYVGGLDVSQLRSRGHSFESILMKLGTVIP